MPAHVKSPGRAAMRLATVSLQSSTGAVEGWGRNSASHWASLSRVAVVANKSASSLSKAASRGAQPAL